MQWSVEQRDGAWKGPHVDAESKVIGLVLHHLWSTLQSLYAYQYTHGQCSASTPKLHTYSVDMECSPLCARGPPGLDTGSPLHTIPSIIDNPIRTATVS